MHIEYSYYDISSNEAETKDNILKATKYPVSAISVLPPSIRAVKGLLPETIKLSSAIDYPLGIMDIKSRTDSIGLAIRNGAKIIELVSPVHLLCNRKYDKFRDDIKINQDLCLEHSVELRYIVEYRLYSYELLYKVSQILLDMGISTIYPSTGFMLDDISDNILASALINKKIPNIHIICNGNFWNNQHAELIKRAKLYGLKVNSLNALDIISKNILKS